MIATQTATNGVTLLRVQSGYLAASRSNPGSWYQISDLADFGVGLLCECPGFQHRGHCAHTTAVCLVEKDQRAAAAAVRKAERAQAPVEQRRAMALAGVADLY